MQMGECISTRGFIVWVPTKPLGGKVFSFAHRHIMIDIGPTWLKYLNYLQQMLHTR